MKVRELIKELKQECQDAEVQVRGTTGAFVEPGISFVMFPSGAVLGIVPASDIIAESEILKQKRRGRRRLKIRGNGK